MRILIVEEFDPAGVCLGHRDALRARGHDCRVALEVAYTDRQLAADWVGAVPFQAGIEPMPYDAAGLAAFVADADIVQFAPGIAQAEALADRTAPCLLDLGREPPEPAAGPVHACVNTAVYAQIEKSPRGRRAYVAFFHGSVNAWAHRNRYAERYRAAGFKLAASTLDYSTEMGAAYLPPVIDCGAIRPVLSRAEGDPLVVAHTPTNPANCHTQELVEAARAAGVPVRFGHRVSHGRALWIKQQCNAGFDHLRGSFSVNHLENCASGLASFCGLRPEYRRRLLDADFGDMPGPAIEGPVDLMKALRYYAARPSQTAALQYACRSWVQNNFGLSRIGRVLEDFYATALREARQR